jgi:hypothetical protein
MVVSEGGSPLGLGLEFVGFCVEEGVGVAVRRAGGDGVEVEGGGGGGGGAGGGGVATGAGDVVVGHFGREVDIVVVWILGFWGRGYRGMLCLAGESGTLGVISSLLGGRAGWYVGVDERHSNKDACGGRRGRKRERVTALLLRDRQWQ